MKTIDKFFDKAIEEGKIMRYPAIKTLAKIMNIPYNRFYKISTQKLNGRPLEKHERNWKAITEFVEVRLDPEHGIGTMGEFVTKVIETEAVMQRSGTLKRFQYTPSYEYKGKHYIGRKFDVQQGEKVEDTDYNIYDVVYVTQTHVVLQTPDTPIVILLANSTYNARIRRVLPNEN